MKLQLKTIPHNFDQGYALFDDNGEILPNQQRVVVDTGIQSGRPNEMALATVTATFVVDGRFVRIVESK